MSTSAKFEIKTLFEGKFDKLTFSKFIINLLNEIEPNSSFVPLRGQYIKAPFREGIVEYERVCKYIDPLGNQIDVLIVMLEGNNKLENARTFQRNFVVDYLNGGRGGKLKDGALVAFYSEDSADWRFSFVKLEYELQAIGGKILEEKIMTSAKRYSFLVGENENSHTAQSQLLPLLIEEEANPTLKQLESAFSIETVTKEFFEKYKDLFLKVKTELDTVVENDSNVKNDFESKEINTADFSKKLLGQIVFLYFLQKKGWFGVERDKPWGSGSKRFLRDLFDGKVIPYNNFFNDILEPLFYESLATDRSAVDHFSAHFKSRIPFLNGGLFDPIANYDWVKTDINIPNELFSNSYISQDKYKDIGTGILDIFDRYNFTVREDEPLEKEVAIDPEMLGKVFENMLDVVDRKSKGTYYTPREIVHYMCQESLINYLAVNLEDIVKRVDIEYLIRKAEFDKQKESAGQSGIHKYSEIYPDSIKVNAKRIDQLLADVKVCDPAIGSGAFPVGMMNEIVKARSNLSVFEFDNIERTEYRFKRHAIAKSLHGVDIDTGAVEIAKLRLWLSLIVDEEDISNIKPLPNLDYKIMQGNSLIEEFEGIRLFDDSLLKIDDSREIEIKSIKQKQTILERKYFEIYKIVAKRNEAELLSQELSTLQKRLTLLNKPIKKEDTQPDLFMSRNEAKEKADKLLILQKKFFETTQKSEKETLKTRIDTLIWELIEVTVKLEGKTEIFKEISKLRRSNTKPFFLWKLNFADVFREKGGFDIVIGNPPYVGESGNKDIFRPIARGNLGKFYQGKMDLFYFFFHLAIDLGKEKAECAFITTNYYLTAFGARKLRLDLKERSTIHNLINFNEVKIFESALGQHNIITIFSNRKTNSEVITANTRRIGTADTKILTDIVTATDSETDYNKITQNDLFDGPEAYIRIFGLNDINNPIQAILNKVQKQGVLLNTVCNINQGVVSGCDYVSGRNFNKLEKNSLAMKNDGIFVLDLRNENDVKVMETFSSEEKKLLKPFYKNSDIGRYWSHSVPSKYLLYYEGKLDESKYPNIAKHLNRFAGILKARLDSYSESYHWTALHRPREEKIFLNTKIVVPYRSTLNTFAINNQEWFCRSDCYLITTKTTEFDLRYVLSLLNSNLYFQWLYHRGKRKGELLELFQVPLSEIPIKEISIVEQKPFIDVVNKIHEITCDANYDSKKPPNEQKELENQINTLVYKLYGLNASEVEFIDEIPKNASRIV